MHKKLSAENVKDTDRRKTADNCHQAKEQSKDTEVNVGKIGCRRWHKKAGDDGKDPCAD